jgi:hypothetical protein
MIRLSPNVQYVASVKSLVTNESREMKASGARLDTFVRDKKFLVTITSTADLTKYAPIDRKAGTKYAQQREEVMASITVS